MSSYGWYEKSLRRSHNYQTVLLLFQKTMDEIENEKGVETTELWVERLRIAAVEHYSKHHVPQGY